MERPFHLRESGPRRLSLPFGWLMWWRADVFRGFLVCLLVGVGSVGRVVPVAFYPGRNLALSNLGAKPRFALVPRYDRPSRLLAYFSRFNCCSPVRSCYCFRIWSCRPLWPKPPSLPEKGPHSCWIVTFMRTRRRDMGRCFSAWALHSPYSAVRDASVGHSKFGLDPPLLPSELFIVISFWSSYPAG